jgi:hypothetical protein
LIAAAVADQRSRVPQSSVRTKIAEVLAPRGRQTFFSDCTPPATYRTLSQPTSRALQTRRAAGPTEAPLLARGRLEQPGVTRSCAPHTSLLRAPQESLPLLLTARNCLRSPVIRSTTRFARGTEVTEGVPPGKDWPIDIPPEAGKLSTGQEHQTLGVSVSLWFAKGCSRRRSD